MRRSLAFLCVGISLGCNEVQAKDDHLVPLGEAHGSRAAYQQLWQEKLLLAPGEIARFVGLPGTSGVETAVSVYRTPGKQDSLPGDYWMTATQASDPLWNCIQPDAEGRVADPKAVRVERCDAPINESTAVAMHKAWLTMLSQARPQRETNAIVVDSSREIFSATNSDGAFLEAESSTAPKENTKALVNIALSLMEYCDAPAAKRTEIMSDIEKTASNLLGRVAVDRGKQPHLAKSESWRNAAISRQERDIKEPPAHGSTTKFTPVKILGKKGVIVTQAFLRESGLPAEAFWKPKRSQLREVERALPKFLKKEKQSRPSVAELSKVIALAPKYRRQYIGMILNGKKVIWINCIPRKPENGADPFKNWNREIVEISDGGSSFWGVVYDIEKHSFEKLILHESA